MHLHRQSAAQQPADTSLDASQADLMDSLDAISLGSDDHPVADDSWCVRCVCLNAIRVPIS
jgi:hypothetical protein